MEQIVKKIKKAKSMILTTHRQCDGDGLGAQLALYHALKSDGKQVSVLNIDPTPRKYRYLSPDNFIQYYEKNPETETKADLCLIFDTNDSRLIEPLFGKFQKSGTEICFIDHHPILEQGPTPTKDSWIDTSCASTGEMAYKLIKKLNLEISREVARCLYTSITFDTQLYRFVRNSPISHLIAAELLEKNIDAEEIHRYLFGHHTISKIAFLSKALGQIEYHSHGKIAVMKFSQKELIDHHLDIDDSRDVIDMIMNIETLEAAAIFREDGKDKYKLSLRSKGKMEVLSIAEKFGGGGHRFAAGATLNDNYDTLHKKIVELLLLKLDDI